LVDRIPTSETSKREPILRIRLSPRYPRLSVNLTSGLIKTLSPTRKSKSQDIPGISSAGPDYAARAHTTMTRRCVSKLQRVYRMALKWHIRREEARKRGSEARGSLAAVLLPNPRARRPRGWKTAEAVTKETDPANGAVNGPTPPPPSFYPCSACFSFSSFFFQSFSPGLAAKLRQLDRSAVAPNRRNSRFLSLSLSLSLPSDRERRTWRRRRPSATPLHARIYIIRRN